MKRLFFLLALLFSASLSAQAPVAVPLKEEPHHHLVLENEYVRVFRVSVPAHSATLLHQHDVPYLYVSLGPADVVNAVQGRPEARIVMADGQVGYSPGHFAHIARTDAGSTFDNVTIELLKPQGEVKNVCAQTLASAPIGNCPESSGRHGGLLVEPLLETGETTVDLVRFDPALNMVSIRRSVLIVFLGETEIQNNSIDAQKERVANGDVMWVSARPGEMIWNSKKKNVSFLQFTFSGTESNAKLQ